MSGNHMDDDNGDDSPAPEEETLSAAEVELAALATGAWQIDSGDWQEADGADAAKAAVAFLGVCLSLLSEGSTQMALSALNQARTSRERAGLLLETCSGPDAERFRAQLIELDKQLRLAWEKIEPLL